jgi:hypothetical protein
LGRCIGGLSWTRVAHQVEHATNSVLHTRKLASPSQWKRVRRIGDEPGKHPQRLVQRARDPTRAAVEHVRIDLGRADITLPEQLLDRPDVVPRLEQMRREAVRKAMARSALSDRAMSHATAGPILVTCVARIGALFGFAIELQREGVQLGYPSWRSERCPVFERFLQRASRGLTPARLLFE